MTNDEYAILLIVVVFLLTLACVLILLIKNRRKARETERLRAYLNSWEKSTRKRHTQSTLAGLEDATAVLRDTLIGEELLEERMAQLCGLVINLTDKQYANEERLRKALSIVLQVRQGPYAYDPDQPAGPRPEGWEH